VSVFNLFDDDGNDITYFYESRLPGEATPVADIQFHSVEPRTLGLQRPGGSERAVVSMPLRGSIC